MTKEQSCGAGIDTSEQFEARVSSPHGIVFPILRSKRRVARSSHRHHRSARGSNRCARSRTPAAKRRARTALKRLMQ